MKTKVYIASPYTLGDVMAHPRPYTDWIAIDLEWVAVCDVLLRLDGVSSGADGEVAYAEERGIPVVYSVEELVGQFGGVAA